MYVEHKVISSVLSARNAPIDYPNERQTISPDIYFYVIHTCTFGLGNSLPISCRYALNLLGFDLVRDVCCRVVEGWSAHTIGCGALRQLLASGSWRERERGGEEGARRERN